MTGSASAPVLIAGAGPVGMILALELGRRDVPCILLNDRPGPSPRPKANATSPRSMEHLRRLGVARRFREAGLPADHPTDVTYVTRLTGYELARQRLPCWRDAVAEVAVGSGPWASPEPPHRASQIFLEQVLYERLADFPAIDRRFGVRLTGFEQDGDGVTCRATDVETGGDLTFRADWLVGCDGPASVVRRGLGIGMAGDEGAERLIMGGTMLAIHVRFHWPPDMARPERSWQFWSVNPDLRALVIAIDGDSEFVVHVALRGEAPPGEAEIRRLVEAFVGRPVDHEIISASPWTAGLRLLADRYREGRCFIAGDAAHLFTPTGGLGMNTGVEDAVNLGWKLAGVVNGWADPAILDTYEADRRPVGARNLAFSKAFADSVGLTPASPEIEADTDAGREERRRIGAHLLEHARREFLIPGIHLGYRYEGSALVAPDGTPAPPDPPNTYTPTARPGHRLPHVWLEESVSVFDRLGLDFTLIRAGDAPPDARALAAAFGDAGIPLQELAIDDPAARALFGAPLLLVAPDQHVLWRGDDVPADPPAIARRVSARKA